MKKNIINILMTLFIGFIIYYFFLPPLNPTSMIFWLFIILLLIIYNFIKMISKLSDFSNIKINKKDIILILLPLIIFGIVIIINIILSPLFNAKKYSKRINIDDTKTFTENINIVDFNTLPLLDKASSTKLGDRVMGQMPELVSQFYVSDLYTQINYNNEIIRITPLEYDGFIKYLTNRKNGVKGYIKVNSVTGKSELIKLKKGMKYMPSSYFGEDLYRKLRFSYPTKIFGEASFEIDNEGNPYWIVPVIKYTGINLKIDVSGIVILNPITGKSEYYKNNDIPTWVDHVYPANIILEQVNSWGKYRGGFFNSIFGQKNVVSTTEGYNYTVMNDDVYLYTGITSLASDESNIGFILTNLRTKETNYYAVPGAEEFSAMASAEGQVQQMKYKASFPLLINLNNRPTYLISLKDNAGLVKMYSFVDVTDYQKVTVTDSSKGIEVAANNYLEENNIEIKNDLIEKEIIVASINSANINGTTFYYIKDQENNKYKASIKINEYLPFIEPNELIKIKYQNNKQIKKIIELNSN